MHKPKNTAPLRLTVLAHVLLGSRLEGLRRELLGGLQLAFTWTSTQLTVLNILPG